MKAAGGMDAWRDRRRVDRAARAMHELGSALSVAAIAGLIVLVVIGVCAALMMPRVEDTPVIVLRGPL